MNSFLKTVLDSTPLPRMALVGQTFQRPKLKDIEGAVREQLSRPETRGKLVAGKRIAITAGSRGIANIALILRTVVRFVQEAGCDPILFSAMGSHGGATEQGQRDILESFGITPETMGVPVYTGTAVTQVSRLSDGTPVCIDRDAAQADGIIIINRIKPHTAFRNDFESGLLKMAVIGMGKQVGAEICHQRGWGNMAQNIADLSISILQHTNILFGLGILENAYDETCKVVSVDAGEFRQKEPALLQEARSLMPSLPFDRVDVLVVDRIGKNISGDGMDPNITGTYFTPFASGGPKTENVVILDLTPESHGSAIGIGAGNFTTKRLLDKMDFWQTYPNALTSKVPDVCKIPMVMPTDQAAIASAIYACVFADRKNARVARIRDSLHVDELYVSEAMMEEVLRQPHVRLLKGPMDMQFDQEGNLF